jgi:hypothetical protein
MSELLYKTFSNKYALLKGITPVSTHIFSSSWPIYAKKIYEMLQIVIDFSALQKHVSSFLS